MRSPYHFCGFKYPLSQAAYPISGSYPSWFISLFAPVLFSRQSTPKSAGLSGRWLSCLRLLVDASLGKQGPDDSSGLIGKRDRDQFVRLAGQQSGQPCRQRDAAFCLFDDRRGADNQERPELAIALFGD